jgi:tetratricopeptide (TPR) repeat protein
VGSGQLLPDQPEHPAELTDRDAIAEAVRASVASGDHEAAAELAANNWRLWMAAGDVAGGRQVMAVALSSVGKPSRARALALYGDGVLAFRAGEQADSKARNEEALEVSRAVGDSEAEALALVGLSRVALRDGDYERVRSLAAEARALTQGLAPDAGAVALHLEAAGTRLSGALDEAVDLYTESLELNRTLDDARMAGIEHHNLGHVELHRGNAAVAERHFAKAAAARTDSPYDSAMTSLNNAALAFAAGERDRAAKLLARVESTLAEAGISLDPDDQFEVDWLRERL